MATIRSRAEQDGGDEAVSAINVELLLPSKLIGRAPCDIKFMDYEWRLRYAQAHTALHDIRRAILLRSQMFKTKDNIVRGQRMHTRSLALIASVLSRITAAAQKYWIVCDALIALNLRTGWEDELKVLNDADLRGLTAGEDGSSEGHRTMSWIWTTSDGTDTLQGEGKQEGLPQTYVSQLCLSFLSSSSHRMVQGSGACAPVAGGVPHVGRGDAACGSLLRVSGATMASLGGSTLLDNSLPWQHRHCNCQWNAGICSAPSRIAT